MQHDDNTSTERPTFVTHLECSYTGERLPADTLQNLSPAGKPLLGALRPRGREEGADQGGAGAASAGPLALPRVAAGPPRRRHRQPRRSDDAAHALPKLAEELGARRDHRQGRRPPAHRFVQGARPGDGRVHGEGARHQAYGDADQRQCRRCPGRLCDLAPASGARSSARKTRRK